jgi:hypothetical protein
MTTTVKKVNYTPAQSEDIKARYVAGGNETTSSAFDARDEIVRELAAEYKPELTEKQGIRSIRSKLSNMKVYIARSTVSGVTGKSPAKKDAMSAALIEAAGDTSMVSKSPLNAVSIEKMNKTEIDVLTMQFDALHNEIGELSGELAAYQAKFGDLPEDENESQE